MISIFVYSDIGTDRYPKKAIFSNICTFMSMSRSDRVPVLFRVLVNVYFYAHAHELARAHVDAHVHLHVHVHDHDNAHIE
jgi:hypothetical protein